MKLRAHQTAWPRPSGACWRGKRHLPRFRHQVRNQLEHFVLAALLEDLFEFEAVIEMIGHDRLAAPHDKDELLDAGRLRLLDRVLDQRLVDDGQHLLGHGLGRRQEAGPQPGNRKNGLTHSLNH